MYDTCICINITGPISQIQYKILKYVCYVTEPYSLNNITSCMYIKSMFYDDTYNIQST